MPSPITHATAGYVVHRLYRKGGYSLQERPRLPLALLAVVASLLPDADFIPGLLSGQIRAFHNQITHSICAGLITGLVSGSAASLLSHTFMDGFWPACLAFQTHLALDLLNQRSRGLMLLWPFSSHRFNSRVKLFYGVKWNRGTRSISHGWTLLSEIAFLSVALLALERVMNFTMNMTASGISLLHGKESLSQRCQ
jgi:hypothetical protein